MTLFIEVGSGFLFSVRKQKTVFFLKISNRARNVIPTPERAEKTSGVALGIFSADLTVGGEAQQMGPHYDILAHKVGAIAA